MAFRRGLITAVVAALMACGSSDGPSCGAGEVANGDTCAPRYDDCGNFGAPIRGGGCSPAGVSECGAGFVSDTLGGCDPVLPASACNGATMAVPGDTACRIVGVGTCAKGFASDGRGGCNASVPTGTCPDGQLAVPGDTSCHELAPCGTSTYGDPPTDAPILYVDGSYTGGSSDGSVAKPFATLAGALAAAAATTTTTIAIAEGSYDGNLDLDKPVRLHGRCPAKVTIRSKTGETAPVLRLVAKGSSVQRVAVTAGTIGIDMTGADTSVEQSWVHDVTSFGIRVQRTTGATVRASLVERATTIGIDVAGSMARIESSLVRSTRARADGVAGNGIEALALSRTSASDLTLVGSVVEQSAAAAILVTSSKATIEGTLVRDNKPDSSNDLSGRGIVGQSTFDDSKTSITVRGSVIERNRSEGIVFYGTDGLVEDTVVRSSRPTSALVYGAITVSHDLKTPLRSSATIRRTLVDDNAGIGVLTSGSSTTIEASLIRATHASGGKGGAGVQVERHFPSKNAADLTVRASAIEGSENLGAMAGAAVLTLESCVVRDNGSSGARLGAGLAAEASKGSCELHVTGSLIERTIGVAVSSTGADLTLDATLIRDTSLPNPTSGGAGVFAGSVPDGARGSLVVTGSVLRHNVGTGVLVVASSATIDRTTVEDTQPAPSGLALGISAQPAADRPDAPELVVRDSLVARSVATGIACLGGTCTIERTIVRETKATTAGKFGDGVAVAVSRRGDVLAGILTLTGSVIRDNARAGAAVFGGSLVLSSSALQCSAFDLDVESFTGQMGQLTDGDGNVCGCKGAFVPCRAASAGLEPVSAP